MYTMGREHPTVVLRPNHNRREDRAKRARDTKNRVIPDLLRSCPRAKHGLQQTELIVDPPPVHETPRGNTDPVTRPDLKIRVKQQDTIYVASNISERPSKRGAATSRSRPGKPNVAVLNMASALRPGGGFLEGANSQEEFLCMRTTLYPSLWDSYYRLPEVSGIYSPDVLVFRDNNTEDNDLHKRDRYFIDVISSSMLRYSDAKSEGCSCSSFSYCDRHRDLVLRKMKAVLRIAQAKGVQRLVLGAWGCGNYGNPVKEIAKAWRKVIAGAPRQRRPNSEQWDGIEEIIFAIPDTSMATEFQRAFSGVLAEDVPTPASENQTELGAERDAEMERTSELMTRMAEIEMQLEQTTNRSLKQRLRLVYEGLQRQINHGAKKKDANSEPEEEQEQEEISIGAEAEDYVMSGFLGSDDEHNPFFTGFDASNASDSDSPAASENFEFRPPPPGMDSQTSHDEHSEAEPSEGELDRTLSESPRFDESTGWFHGSLQGLASLLNVNRGLRSCSRTSPGSPDVMRPSSSGLPIDADALHAYLKKHGGTDVVDY